MNEYAQEKVSVKQIADRLNQVAEAGGFEPVSILLTPIGADVIIVYGRKAGTGKPGLVDIIPSKSTRITPNAIITPKPETKSPEPEKTPVKANGK